MNQRNARPIFAAAIGILILALLVTACGSAPAPEPTEAPAAAAAEPTATEEPEAAEPLYSVALPGVVSYELNLPSLVAYANDYFGEEGIEITEFVTGSGGTLRTAMIAEEYDIGLFGFVHVPLARLAESPWKAVLSTHDLEIFTMVVRSELADEVKTVADLKGRKVGVSRPGAASWSSALQYLSRDGLDPELDTEIIPLGGDPAVIYTSLTEGEIDAFSAWEPTTSRVIAEGAAYPLMEVWNPADHQEWWGSDKALSMVLVTREDVIQENRDMVERMVNAHKKGLEYIATHDAAEIADVVLGNSKTAEMFTGLDRELVVEIIKKIKPGFGDGCLSRSGFETEMELAVQYEIVDGPISFEDFADTSFTGECP